MPSKRVRLGINGPGVIGRNLIRMFVDYPEFNGKISAINYHQDKPSIIASLLKYDSIYGPWSTHQIKPNGSKILIDQDKVFFYSQSEANKIPWDKAMVDIVIDSSRVYNDPLKAKEHFKRNHIKKVIITSSPKENDCPIIVYGVNHKSIDPKKDKIISAATCSSNCLISTLFVLDNAFSLESVYALTTHAQTGENEIYDKLQEGTDGRSIADNIVPSQTGANKTIYKVLPHFKDKLKALSIKCNRIPILTGSVFDITVRVEKPTSKDEVIEVFKKAALGDQEGVILLTDDPVTAADIRGLPHPAIIPTPYIDVLEEGKVILLKAFYDNIRGFNSQIGRLVKYLAS